MINLTLTSSEAELILDALEYDRSRQDNPDAIRSFDKIIDYIERTGGFDPIDRRPDRARKYRVTIVPPGVPVPAPLVLSAGETVEITIEVGNAAQVHHWSYTAEELVTLVFDHWEEVP